MQLVLACPKKVISGGIKLGPLIIPLYQNWEEKNKIPNNFEWIKERVQIYLGVFKG